MKVKTLGRIPRTNNLHARRLRLGLTLHAVGVMVGLPPTTISLAERNVRKLSDDEAERLEKFFASIEQAEATTR